MEEAFVGGWSRQPDFSDERLGALHGLNHRFLDLVSASAADWRFPRRLELPGDACDRVAPLSASQRAAAANCPYALFDLRFHDHEHWHARLSSGARFGVADETAAGETTDFVRLVLFFAWHVAESTKLSARLLLGMSERTAEAFRGAGLNRLPDLAPSEVAHLTPRWRTSGAYWSALLRAASGVDSSRLRRVQLFGLQLAAAARLP